MRILFKVLSVFILLSGTAFSQTDGLKLLGRWPDGPCRAVAVDGNYAYINNGSALEILDISDTAAFKSVGRLDLADYINCIRVSGAYAYVSGDYGLYIVDISDKTSPKRTGSLSLSYAASMFVKENFLYAACPVSGLNVIDITVPSEPKITADVLIDKNPFGIFVVDSLAFVCCRESGLFVLGVKNKTAPSTVGYYNFNYRYFPNDIYVKDSIAYVTCDENNSSYYKSGSLHSLNIKNPLNIFEKYSIPLTGDWHSDAGKVTVEGNYAFTAYWTDVGGYVTIAEVSNNGYLHEVQKKHVEYVNDLAVRDKRLFVTDEHEGIISFDITNPASPLERASFKTAGYTGAVARRGNYLYVANSTGGLKVLDISKPSDPSVVFSYKGSYEYESCNTVFVKDTLLFAGFSTGGNGFLIYSLGNMPDLKKISELQEMEVDKIVVSGNYAYAASPKEFTIYNVADPLHPDKIFSYSITTTRDLDLVLNGTTLCVLERMAGIKIFDVSNPANTVLIKDIPLANALDFSINSGYLYVSIYKGGVKIFDVSDPKNSREVGEIAEQNAYKIRSLGGYAYLFCQYRGLKVYNVKNPASPYLVRSEERVKAISELYVDEDYIILSESSEGLSIFTNDITSSVGDRSRRVKDFALLQNYPNPFNPATTISYSIPVASHLDLKVIDMLGREVASLVNKEQNAGEYKVQFDASHLTSGMYIYQIQAGQFRESRKMIILK